MSAIEIYSIAKVAREKLLSEGHLKDYDLHKLVAHATLYDNLFVAYYRQEEEETENVEKSQYLPPTRRVTFKVPVER